MGPWPGIEPGLREPQSLVLTPTPPQPSRLVALEESGISIIRLTIAIYQASSCRDN